MIEEVDPNDTATLDEIDARVWAYLNLKDDFKISFHKDCGAITYRHNSWPQDERSILRHGFSNPKYTRSFDAIHSIASTDFVYNIEFVKDGWGICSYSGISTEHNGETPSLVSPELAYLHAIIQAIAHERGEL